MFLIGSFKRDKQIEAFRRYAGDCLYALVKFKNPKIKLEPYSKIVDKVENSKHVKDDRTEEQIIDDTLKVFSEYYTVV